MSSTAGVTDWAGNLAVQKIVQAENGELVLAPVDAVADGFTARRVLAAGESHVFVEAGEDYAYQVASGEGMGAFYAPPAFTGDQSEAAQAAEAFPSAPEGTLLRQSGEGTLEASYRPAWRT